MDTPDFYYGNCEAEGEPQYFGEGHRFGYRGDAGFVVGQKQKVLL